MQVTSTDDAERMRKVLTSLLDDVGTFVNDSGPYPAVGSIAAREQSECDAEQLDAAYLQGNLLLESAFDHVFALTRLLVPPVPTIAPWTCLRGGLEAAAICCWLLTASTDPKERIARSFAYRYEGLCQQVKLARATGSDAQRKKTLKRIEEVEAKALALGYSPIVKQIGKQKGARDGIGQRMPQVTQLVSSAFGEDKLYRIHSAMAHGDSFALIQLGFHAPDATQPTLRQKAMNSDAAAILLMTAADAVAKPLWTKTFLLGHDAERLKSLLAGRYREMGLSESRFFWSNGWPS